MNVKITKLDLEGLEDIENYIDENYRESIRQKDLERIGMMSGTSLKTKFKKKNNMNITEYLQRTRVKKGEILLSETDMEIREIAKAVGYSSHSRFSEIFKRYRGMCPKDYRKRVDLIS